MIDDHLTIGSYNYTQQRRSGMRKAESVTFVESRELAREYLANWDGRLKVLRSFEASASH
ncbi:hypothetical protein thsrh120_48910 [Rhizobium sp. No.120]